MKCKCGGETTYKRVTKDFHNKKYRMNRSQCLNCQKEYFQLTYFIPTKGKTND